MSSRKTRTIVTVCCLLIVLALLIFLSRPSEAQGGLVRTTPSPVPPDPWAAFETACAPYEASYLRVDDEAFVWQGSPAAFRWYYNQIEGYPYYLVVQVNGDPAGTVTAQMGGFQAQRQYPYGAWVVSGIPMMVDVPVPDTFGVSLVRSDASGVQEVRFRLYRPRLPWEFQPN